ncbi:unnamed protein product [Rotaria sp. Silwood2]|nr:unnamed protein product [Rotaria sp. Silwood2]CAF2811830.1 unnamed protein product [Rotaria sp. Silwood2]CAF2977825.1 unnamed protein product [Rotaria sp. Silwood2]CAF3272366.1 unnamed protein product [Rotaria sp. Silwood2]CAF3868487.1 unnamed protein product [Rotaria sp. Silwood2]
MSFVYQYTQFAQLISTVQNDKNTISISTQTDTLAREQFVNFAHFFATGTAFLVRSSYGQPINALSDLCGKRVVVQATSIQEIDLKTQNSKCGGNNITIQSVPSRANLINAVQSGTADVAVYDEAPLHVVASQSNNALKVVGQPYDVQPYGILCNQQNSVLCCALVDAINYLIQQGTYEQLLAKYSFSYKNNGVCPSRVNLNGTTCLTTCTPSASYCTSKFS